MNELGYSPHAGARAMKVQRTATVGVVVADLDNSFYAEMIDVFTTELDRAGYRTVVWNAARSRSSDALRAIRESAIDGVLFATATSDSAELQAAVERSSPIVLVNRVIDDLDCDRVSSDNLAGGAAVADFLATHGRTHAAYIGGDVRASTSRDRGRGFLERMAAHGHTVPDHLRIDAGFSHDAAMQHTRKLLALTPRPSAIFCANDNMAFGALDALREAGASPEECWVIGYDDVEMASWPSFALTTVRQPSRDMAAEGVRLLLARLADPQKPVERINYPCTLIVRGSTPLT